MNSAPNVIERELSYECFLAKAIYGLVTDSLCHSLVHEGAIFSNAITIKLVDILLDTDADIDAFKWPHNTPFHLAVCHKLQFECT